LRFVKFQDEVGLGPQLTLNNFIVGKISCTEGVHQDLGQPQILNKVLVETFDFFWFCYRLLFAFHQALKIMLKLFASVNESLVLTLGIFTHECRVESSNLLVSQDFSLSSLPYFTNFFIRQNSCRIIFCSVWLLNIFGIAKDFLDWFPRDRDNRFGCFFFIAIDWLVCIIDAIFVFHSVRCCIDGTILEIVVRKV